MEFYSNTIPIFVSYLGLLFDQTVNFITLLSPSVRMIFILSVIFQMKIFEFGHTSDYRGIIFHLRKNPIREQELHLESLDQ